MHHNLEKVVQVVVVLHHHLRSDIDAAVERLIGGQHVSFNLRFYNK